MNDYEKNFGEDKSSLQRFLELLSLLIVIGMTLYTAMMWQGLPDQIATHFDAVGKADGYGSKWTLWWMVALMFLMYGTMFLAPKMKKFYNYPVKITKENEERQFELVSIFMRVIIFESILLLSFIQWSTVNNALDESENLNPIVMIVIIGLMVVSTVMYITKSIRNR